MSWLFANQRRARTPASNESARERAKFPASFSRPQKNPATMKNEPSETSPRAIARASSPPMLRRLSSNRLASVLRWKIRCSQFHFNHATTFFIRPHVFDRRRSRATANFFPSPKSPPPADARLYRLHHRTVRHPRSQREMIALAHAGNAGLCKMFPPDSQICPRRRIEIVAAAPFSSANDVVIRVVKCRRNSIIHRRFPMTKFLCPVFFRYSTRVTNSLRCRMSVRLKQIFRPAALQATGTSRRRILAASNIFFWRMSSTKCSAPPTRRLITIRGRARCVKIPILLFANFSHERQHFFDALLETRVSVIFEPSVICIRAAAIFQFIRADRRFRFSRTRPEFIFRQCRS